MNTENSSIESRIRVLLIDDDEDEYVIIKKLLSESYVLSFDVSWAENYMKAYDILTHGNFDVCLIDFMLGDKDGIEAIRDFKKKGIRVPFILLTGRGDYDLDMMAMQEGAVDYLEKCKK